MALTDRYSFEDLVNESERFVLEELERQLEARTSGDGRLKPPPDEDTILDLAAYALNNVPPRYRVNLLGRLYARSADERYLGEVQTAVRRAIEKVLDSPPGP